MSISTLFLSIFLLIDYAITTITLTTSFKSLDDIVRPTASARRWNSLSDIFVRSINDQALYNTSMSFRKSDNDETEVPLSELWNWDYWCKLQPVVGTCDQNIRNFGLYLKTLGEDLQTELCKPITYSGCSGGKNMFDTKKDCERTCLGANDMLKPSLNFVEQLDCFYQPDPGLCLGYVEQYFYDVNLETCRSFIYGGCGGNANRFKSAPDCLKNCKGTKRRTIRGEDIIGYER